MIAHSLSLWLLFITVSISNYITYSNTNSNSNTIALYSNIKVEFNRILFLHYQ